MALNHRTATGPEVELGDNCLTIWEGNTGWRVYYPASDQAERVFYWLTNKISEIDSNSIPLAILGEEIETSSQLISKFIAVARSAGLAVGDVNRRSNNES